MQFYVNRIFCGRLVWDGGYDDDDDGVVEVERSIWRVS